MITNGWTDRPADSSAPLKAFVMRLIPADSFSPRGLVVYQQQRDEQVLAHQVVLKQAQRALEENAGLGQHLALGYGSDLAIAELAWLDSTLNIV